MAEGEGIASGELDGEVMTPEQPPGGSPAAGSQGAAAAEEGDKDVKKDRDGQGSIGGEHRPSKETW